ncbi:MAG: toll/interleukin-1 receptor domain-containing protein [Desulfomonilaceae bacterium]
MDTRFNKPRVFLSHSKADEKFIRRLYADLKKCQIEPWLDSEDIRHGKPWLDAIFEEGIPTCDCVIVYFSETSLDSAMVKKEIDVGILAQLKESHVAFLPYVSSAEIRQKLRPDIQALQAPVWNGKNYSSLLPRVVAEIWRSFLERTVSDAVRAEKLRRVESELQLEKMKHSAQGGIFTESENRDFEYIQKQLDRFELVTFDEQKREEKEWQVIERHTFYVNIGSIIPFISDSVNSEYKDYVLRDLLNELLRIHIKRGRKDDQKSVRFDLVSSLGMVDDLLMYGFVSRERVHSDEKTKLFSNVSFGPEYRFVYTGRIDRFKYWLAVNGKFPKGIISKKEMQKSKVLVSRFG